MLTMFKRVYETAECKTQVELADILGIRQSSISDAKRRNSIPAEWLIKLYYLKQINPDWILTGEGPKYLAPSETPTPPHVIRITEIKPPEECSAQDLINELVRRALKVQDFTEIQKQAENSWVTIQNTAHAVTDIPSLNCNEELTKLVKEFGIFKYLSEFPNIDVDENDNSAVLIIDLAAAGYFKPRTGLDKVIESLFPQHILDGESLEENGKLTVYLANREKRESANASRKKLEQKLHAHIKKNAEFYFYGDTNVLDDKKEVVCKVVFDISDYFPGLNCYPGEFDAYLWSVTKLYLTEYEWVHVNGGYTFGGKVYVVLVSKAFWRRYLLELSESINKGVNEP